MDNSGQEILRARERLASIRSQWNAENRCVIQIMNNIPGPRKMPPYALPLLERCLRQVERELAQSGVEVADRLFLNGDTNPVMLLQTTGSPIEMKEICLRVEKANPLGPYWDLDVFCKDGGKITRAALGEPPRSCFLCHRPAKVCAFLQSHANQALLEKLERDVKRYL